MLTKGHREGEKTVIEGWAPATYDALAEWAGDLGFRCETRDYPDGYGGRNRKLTVNGTVSAEFQDMLRRVTVKWGDGEAGEFKGGLPLAALTGLVSGLLAAGAGEGASHG